MITPDRVCRERRANQSPKPKVQCPKSGERRPPYLSSGAGLYESFDSFRSCNRKNFDRMDGMQDKLPAGPKPARAEFRVFQGISARPTFAPALSGAKSTIISIISVLEFGQDGRDEPNVQSRGRVNQSGPAVLHRDGARTCRRDACAPTACTAEGGADAAPLPVPEILPRQVSGKDPS